MAGPPVCVRSVDDLLALLLLMGSRNQIRVLGHGKYLYSLSYLVSLHLKAASLGSQMAQQVKEKAAQCQS